MGPPVPQGFALACAMTPRWGSPPMQDPNGGRVRLADGGLLEPGTWNLEPGTRNLNPAFSMHHFFGGFCIRLRSASTLAARFSASAWPISRS